MIVILELVRFFLLAINQIARIRFRTNQVLNLKYILIEPLKVVITLLGVGRISNFSFAAPLGPAELNLLREEREREREREREELSAKRGA